MDLPKFTESLEASAPANLPQELTDHLPVAQAAAARNLEAAKVRYGPELTSLQSQLRHAQTPAAPVGSKLIRLRHIAGERSRFHKTSLPCARADFLTLLIHHSPNVGVNTLNLSVTQIAEDPTLLLVGGSITTLHDAVFKALGVE
jgi:hypothetical protein